MKYSQLIFALFVLSVFLACTKENEKEVGPQSKNPAPTDTTKNPVDSTAENPKYILKFGNKVYSKIDIESVFIGDDGEVLVHGNQNDNAVLSPFLFYITPENEIQCDLDANSSWQTQPRLVNKNEIIWRRDTFALRTADPNNCQVNQSLNTVNDWQYPVGATTYSQKGVEVMDGYAFAAAYYWMDSEGHVLLHRLENGSIDKSLTIDSVTYIGLFVLAPDKLAVVVSLGSSRYMYCYNANLQPLDTIAVPGYVSPKNIFAGQTPDGKPDNTFFHYTLLDWVNITKFDGSGNILWKVSQKSTSDYTVAVGPDLNGGCYAITGQLQEGVRLVHYDRNGTYLGPKLMPAPDKDYDFTTVALRQIPNHNKEIVVVGRNPTQVTLGAETFPYSFYLFVSRVQPF